MDLRGIGTLQYEFGRNEFGRYQFGRHSVGTTGSGRRTLVPSKASGIAADGSRSHRPTESANLSGAVSATAGPDLADIVRMLWPGL